MSRNKPDRTQFEDLLPHLLMHGFELGEDVPLSGPEYLITVGHLYNCGKLLDGPWVLLAREDTWGMIWLEANPVNSNDYRMVSNRVSTGQIALDNILNWMYNR